VARPLVLAAALAVSLLAVSGAGGTGAQTPKRGGTVVDAVSFGEPPCLNTFLAECHASAGGWDELIDQTLQPAVEPGPRGWRNVLVSSLTLTKKPFAVIYHIRPEARWSDGMPVRAADFVFSYQMQLRYSPQDVIDTLSSEVRRVVVLNAKTLRVEYREPYKFWRSLVQVPLPRHVLAGADFATVWKDGIDDPSTGIPIGDGPFLVQSWEKGQQLVLVRNRHFWAAHTAYLDHVVFRFVDPADDADALQNGAVDVVGDAQAQGTTFELAQAPPPGVRVLSAPSANWEHFEIRLGRRGQSALKKTLVRRALAYGIDRVALVRRLYSDIAPNASVVDSTVYLLNEPEYRANWSRYRYNPTLARRLLETAGCHRGRDGVYVCAGERLLLRFVTNADNSRRTRTLRIVKAQLSRIGVEVQPVYAPRGAFFDDQNGILVDGDFDVALFAWGHRLDVAHSTYRCGDGQNFSGFCSRLVNADADKLNRIADPARQAPLANRIDRVLAQYVPTLPLFQSPVFVAVRTFVHGVVPSAFNDPTWNAVDWWVER
jgi:peptide/nickel transport system substrate-binding protein